MMNIQQAVELDERTLALFRNAYCRGYAWRMVSQYARNSSKEAYRPTPWDYQMALSPDGGQGLSAWIDRQHYRVFRGFYFWMLVLVMVGVLGIALLGLVTKEQTLIDSLCRFLLAAGLLTFAARCTRGSDQDYRNWLREKLNRMYDGEDYTLQRPVIEHFEKFRDHNREWVEDILRYRIGEWAALALITMNDIVIWVILAYPHGKLIVQIS